MLQSTHGRFDLERIVGEFGRHGGEQVAEIVRRVYGGRAGPVTDGDWARCWPLFGPTVPSDDVKARIVRHEALNARGLGLMRGFDVLDRLAAVDCPTLVCVGELDPITPIAAARELAAALPSPLVRVEVLAGAGHVAWLDVPDRYWPLLTEFVVEHGWPRGQFRPPRRPGR